MNKEDLTPRQKQMIFRDNVRLLFSCVGLGIVMLILIYSIMAMGSVMF